MLRSSLSKLCFNEKRERDLFTMNAKQFLVGLGGIALASAQVPPPTGILSTTLSGVLPVLPTETPFTGLGTIEGAIVYDGPVVEGFTGEVPLFLMFLAGSPYKSFSPTTTTSPSKRIILYYLFIQLLISPGPGGNATIQTSNPPATYIAVLPPTNFDPATGSVITGSVTVTANANGTGILISVNLTGFPSPSLYSPFVYHIHALLSPRTGTAPRPSATSTPLIAGNIIRAKSRRRRPARRAI
jgi:hypothetical protein